MTENNVRFVKVYLELTMEYSAGLELMTENTVPG